MNIDIAVLTCLKLITVHKKFTVKLFIQFIKDQASLGSNQSTVCVGIALITDITDCLALGIYVIHHVDKIQFIISVIPVTFSYSWIYSLQGTLYYVVHLLDLDLIFSQGSCMLLGKLADKILLFLRKSIQNPGC